MTSPLLPNWTDTDRASFQRKPMVFAHSLLDTGMFSEAAIARLLETHPDPMTDLNINDIHDDGTCQIHTGTRGGLSGEALLDAVKEGRLWINLRHAFQADGSRGSIVDRLFAELSAHNPGLKPVKVYANLLISAPQARVPYHADTPNVALFHLIGRKRIWIYPNHGKFLRDEAMERVALRETSEDLPYDPAWDAEATVFDLLPGQAVSWPCNAPHRVDNLGTFNVSLSCEFMTWEARLRHGTLYTNGTLRRRFGMNPPPLAGIGPVGRAARWGLSNAFKALKVNRRAQAVFNTDFDVARGTTPA
jgi:hypothetical protein